MAAKTKPILAMELDDVILDTTATWERWCLKMFKETPEESPPKELHERICYDWKWRGRWSRFRDEMHTEIPYIKGACAALHALSPNWNLILITSRPNVIGEALAIASSLNKASLDKILKGRYPIGHKHGPCFAPVAGHLEYAETTGINLDALICREREHLLACSPVKKRLLFQPGETAPSWWRRLNDWSDGITRVTSWPAIVAHLSQER